MFLFSGPLILVASGLAWYSEFTDLSQVVDLNSNTSCSNLQKFLSKIAYSTGALLNNIPIICGGEDSKLVVQNSCFAYDKSSESWLLHAKMSKRRSLASATVINDALWVSGSWDGGSYEL